MRFGNLKERKEMNNLPQMNADKRRLIGLTQRREGAKINLGQND